MLALKIATAMALVTIAIGMVVYAVVVWRQARRRKAQLTRDPQPAKPAAPQPSESRPRMFRKREDQPGRLPFEKVEFEFIILSRSGKPIDEDEFMHKLLMGKGADEITSDMRLLLDFLSISSEQRVFVEGRAKREPETFRASRHLANRGQIHMNASDHDLIVIGRGAHHVTYAGPPLSGGAHLKLVVRAAEIARRMRPGIVVDRAAMQIWGEHAWTAKLESKSKFEIRDHLKIEAVPDREGMKLATRGMLKFGMPDIRAEGLPQDMTGIGAVAMTSISLDLIHAEGALDPTVPLEAPVVRGKFAFQFEPPSRQSNFPRGAFRLLGAVRGEEPSTIGLLEVFSRLRQHYEDGDTFWSVEPGDLDATRRKAIEELPRLKQKFLTRDPSDEQRIFLVRRQPRGAEDAEEEFWMLLRDWSGEKLEGAMAVGAARTGEKIAIMEDDIVDWMILRGGDVEDGGFALRFGAEDGQ